LSSNNVLPFSARPEAAGAAAPSTGAAGAVLASGALASSALVKLGLKNKTDKRSVKDKQNNV